MSEDLQGLKINREKRPGNGTDGGGRVWILTSCLLFVALLGLSLYAFWWEPSAKSASAPAVAAADDHKVDCRAGGNSPWIGAGRGNIPRQGI